MTVQASPRWANDEDFVARVLELMRAWTPFDGEAVLDDVAAALDDVPPGRAAAGELAQRLHAHLTQLVNIAASTQADRSGYAATLLQRARTVQTTKVPGHHRRAVTHLRRTGWVTGELLDLLVALHCVKEAA